MFTRYSPPVINKLDKKLFCLQNMMKIKISKNKLNIIYILNIFYSHI